MNPTTLRRFVQLSLLVLLLLLFYSLYLHLDIDENATYVTSESCRECHVSHYDSWRENSLHPYMFLPVSSPDAKILGDFASGDPAVTFKKEEIEFVVGSRWEQVYARKIDGEYYPFPAKWYVIQQRWVPYKVEDWRDTPMSYKCNGCHTTGFDPNTLEFAEFGVGCEACHGPGSLHVQNQQMEREPSCTICHREPRQSEAGDIIRSVSPSVCGQCHSRGTSPTREAIKGTQFNFPAGFKPGDDLRTVNFNPSTPQQDKKGKYWWGNGLSKNRHQEFADWSKSGHSQSLTNLLESHADTECVRGRLSDGCLHCHSTDYRHAPKDDRPDLKNARFGITCVACHEPHGRDKQRPGFGDGVAVCGGCHLQAMANDERRHTPCPNGQVACVDCHMPLIVKNGGFFSLRSHAFRIIPPKVSQVSKMPNSCQNGDCHANRDLQWAITAYEDFYAEKP